MPRPACGEADLAVPALRRADAPGAPPDEWSALMALAQAGDAAAYRRLLAGITPYVRAIASRAHRNPSDAEETVQDVLMTLHSIRHTYDPARSFKPWLAGITRHRMVDRLRVLGRASAREVAFDFSLGHDRPPDAAAHDGLTLDSGALHGALASLPPGQRQAVTLLKLQELSLKEVSAITGQSAGALKTATHRAMAALRALLRQRDGEP